MTESRGRFLRRAAAGAVSLAGAGTLAGGAAARAETVRGDVALLSYQLRVQRLELAFYDRALADGVLDPDSQLVASSARPQEAAHVAALNAALRALGASLPAADRYAFRGTTAEQNRFRRTAIMLEDLATQAAVGAAAEATLATTRKALAQVAAVDARQSAWLRELSGGGIDPKPVPRALEVARTRPQARAILDGTGFVLPPLPPKP